MKEGTKCAGYQVSGVAVVPLETFAYRPTNPVQRMPQSVICEDIDPEWHASGKNPDQVDLGDGDLEAEEVD